MFLARLILTILGARFGGLPGAAMGFVVGQLLDYWLGKQDWASVTMWGGRPGGKQRLFTENVTILAAKLAKVDGLVTREEVDAFKAQFHIPPDLRKRVGALYNEAKKDARGFEIPATKLAESFAGTPALLAAVLDGLTRIAMADGAVTLVERDFLARVAEIFGLAGYRHAAPGAQGSDDPYAKLGVTRGVATDEIKKVWRKLSRENHPDALMGKGLSPEQAAMSSRKMAEINAAYDRIMAERGES